MTRLLDVERYDCHICFEGSDCAGEIATHLMDEHKYSYEAAKEWLFEALGV